MSRVAITGASGFIGGRIVELLNAQPGHEMRLLVRRFGGLARAVRYPVEVIRPRAWDVAGVAEVLEGCDTVLHCAHDWNDAGWNVAFAKTLVRASAQAGVDAIVALSSASVYYPSAEPTIVERAHATSTPWEYAQVKRDVTEALLSESRAHDIPAAVLEPPCVYGPFSGFANVPAQQLRAGRVVVPTDDEGIAHLVHVDDVTHAMLAAADSRASGRFLVTGAQPVTWSWFYGAIQREIGAGEVVPMSAAAVDELLAPTAGAAVRRARTDPRVVLSSPRLALARNAVHRIVGDARWSKARAQVPRLVLPEPSDRLYRWSRAMIDDGRARSELGYAPAKDISRGMAELGEYLRWARL